MKIEKNILDSLKKPWLLFIGLVFLINSPFVFFDVIQHDDWNFFDECYRDNIIVHQARLDRPLSGLLQGLIFKIWRFRDFQDFKLFRLLSILTISIAATLIFFSVRKYSCKKANFMAVLAFVCLPGFSYVVLLNLLSTASLAFLLSLVGGCILCDKPFSLKKIVLATILIICSASIHQIMSLFILLPCLIKIIFEREHERDKFIFFCMAAIVAAAGNLLNIILSVFIIKPLLALKWGKIVFLPLIPTHSSNWDITSIKNKLPVFFSDFIAFGATFSMFEYKVAGWGVVVLIISCFVYKCISEKFPRHLFLNTFYSIGFLFICYSPFLFSNSDYCFTRSILPASGLLIFYTLYLLKLEQQKAYSLKRIGLYSFLALNIVLSFKNNFTTSLGIQSEYYYIKNEFLKNQSSSNEKALFILQQPDYQKGNILNNKIFADEWNFLNFLPVGNRHNMLSLIEKEQKMNFDILAYPSEFIDSIKIPILFENTIILNPQATSDDLFLNKSANSLILQDEFLNKQTLQKLLRLFYDKRPFVIEEDLNLIFVLQNNSNEPLLLSLSGNDLGGVAIHDTINGEEFKNQVTAKGDKTKAKYRFPISCKKINVLIKSNPAKTIDEILLSNEAI